MRAAAIPSAVGALALTLAPASTAADHGALTPSGRVPESAGVKAAAADAAARGIEWRHCPAAERLPGFVECGTVSVPVDYARPDGEQIHLTVSRARATGDSDQHLGSLVYNPGGPGGSAMKFPLYSKLGGLWKRLNASYDFVGYAPRGVGRSDPLSCQDPAEFLRGPNHSPEHPGPEFKQAMKRKAAAYAAGCAKAQPDRLRHYTTPNNARDLDVLRAALGQRKLNYLGVSYGTYIGSVYATLFPGHVRRLVLDSVVDPSPESVWYQANLDQDRAFERRWADWKSWVARHHDTYRLGHTAQQVQRSFDAVRAAVDRRPAGGTVGSKELLATYLDTGYADVTWAPYAQVLSDFREGDPEPLVKLAAPKMEKARSEENGNAVYNAVECQDAPWPRDWERWERDNTATAAVAPFNTWENAWMNLPCAYWKTQPDKPLDVGADASELPDVLLVAATHDAATPYDGALETQRRLAGSSLVTERGAGNHGVSGGNPCMDTHIERYLLDGKTPGTHAECAARPEPRPGARQRALPSANTRVAR
ncbi:alpha/beta hydrolase [Streptomyces spirodelae]|uniref:Alpha/beta fold hydrolase n=1 Tax=Streptomyces spirodelae TaxID=2812904 RepID=A0ABS3WR06_9ACTN|nr:alpha/beta hydrolase [Streptomyces spirodelae]MBO8185454.1 alpha/beta fold hydrolase [Streptomyces spirodelae]